MFQYTLHATHLLSLTMLIFASCSFYAWSHPAYSRSSSSSSTYDGELIVVEEVLRCTPEWCRNATTGAQDNADNESEMDARDDLIFLAKKQKHIQQLMHTSSPNEQDYLQRNTQQNNKATTFQHIDLLEGQQQQDALASSFPYSKALEHDIDDDFDDDSSGNGGNVEVVDIVLHEIELYANNSDVISVGGGSGVITNIDMSDFVTLIPAEKVKSIAANYYQHDVEVQRVYAYLRSADFAALKRHIIQVPEMVAFIRYLNNSGLDVVGFLNAVTTLTATRPMILNEGNNENTVAATNEIFNSKTPEAITTLPTTFDPVAPFEVTTTRQQLNGLHGLVDSVLSALPQDKILSTFFDKLESDERFSKLVGNIGSPAFAKIITDIERSMMLRNLIFSLHNNGIFLTRIVDSLKAYFFLGGF